MWGVVYGSVGVSALHYSTRNTEGSEGFGHWLSACVLHLTTYYHMLSISYSILEVWKLIWKQSIALEEIEHRV